MESLPGMWRTELWHPLSVHFPIALLIFATLFLTAARLISSYKSYLLFTGRLLLVFGVPLVWWAVYSGTLADSVVGRYVCDPTVLEDHERFAYITAYLFTAGLLAEFLLTAKRLISSEKIKKLLSVISLVLLVSGSATLGYVGHLGAKLVYQQGAGVHHPSEDCGEFE